MDDRAIICVGNRSRSDDAVGFLIAEELQGRHLDVPVHLSAGEPGELLDLWEGLGLAIVVDAVVTRSGAPGTLVVLDASRAPLPTVTGASSHGIGLAESIELARSLHRLPDAVRVVGIEAGSLQPGRGLTPAVRHAIPAAVDRIVEEIHRA